MTVRTCQFIHGDIPKWPEQPDWCGLRRKPGSPYCEKHHKICHDHKAGKFAGWKRGKAA